jgi:hypothetical protein
MLHDSWVPLAEAGAGRYSASFLEAIDRALAVRPEQRTQTIDLLRQELGLPPAHVPGGAPAPRVDPEATVIRPARTTAPTVATAAQPAAAAGTVAAPAARQPTLAPRTVAPAETPAAATAEPPAAERAAAPRRTAMLAALGLGVLVAGGAAWWLTRGPATPAPAPVVTATPTPPAAPAPGPVVAAAPPAAALAPPPAAPPPPPPPPPRAVPRSPAEAYALWQAEGGGALRPQVRAPASLAVSELGKSRIGVTAPQAGYVHLVAALAGGSELQLWHPGATPQRIGAGATLEITPAAWSARPPAPGRWQVMAIVTSQPWDLAADGWREQGGVRVHGFDAAATPASTPCPPGSGPCDAFGAAEFTLEVRAPAPAAPVVAAPPERKPPPVRATPPAAAQNSEECGRIIAQMSLGDTSPALAARFKALGCR